MTIRVALYADPKSRLEFTGNPENAAITRMYSRVFGSRLRMQFVYADAVRRGTFALFKPHIFILPGVLGQTSYCPRDIGHEGYAHLRRFVENGGVIDAYCAGAYDVTPEILWAPSSGPQKVRSLPDTLGIVKKVKAFGPVGDYCQPVEENRKAFFTGWYRVDAVPVILDTGKRIKMAYGEGPGFEIKDEKNITVRARYAEVAGQPPAIIEAKCGKGFVSAHGVLMQYTHMHQNTKTDLDTMPASQRALLRDLYKYRRELTAFSDAQLKRMAAHHNL